MSLHTRRLVLSAVAGLYLGSGPAFAQADAEVAAKAEVVVLGASLSAGFICPWTDGPDAEPNRTVKLRQALAVFWDRQRVRITDRSDVMTFLDPVGKQGARIERAVEDEPGLVVAIDFLFWFGYGHVPGPDRTASRLALLEQGLAMLDRLDCPVVVGDFPDMHGADPRMLQKSQIPDVETLAKLNERVRGWAEGRKDVVLFPLAAWVAEMKATGRVVEVEGEALTLGPQALLQSDDLHPTRLGVAVVAHGVAELLAERFEAGDALRPRPVGFEELAEGIGAAVDLEGHR